MAEIELVGPVEGEILKTLSLAETESISNSSFEQILEENEQLLIALVHTRDRSNFRKKY